MTACSLDRQIEVKLPVFEKQLVAECYLERGMPMKILLTESDPYFDTLRFPFVNEATIEMSFGDTKDTIPFFPTLDLQVRKFYNFGQKAVVQPSEGEVCQLLIKDPKGRFLQGSTQFLPEPAVDSVEVRYSPDRDSLASILVWINDIANQTNFYRIIMNEDSLGGFPSVDFTFTDNGLDGTRFPVGTSFRFERGKEMIIRIYHIEQQYYNYLRALEAASRANGNPFSQPSTIKSPMNGGGFGIFTTLNYRTINRKL